MQRGGHSVRLKGLKQYTSNGIDYVYHRPTGTRLPPMSDPGFLDAYVLAEKAKPKPGQNRECGPPTVEDVFRQLLRSDRFSAYSSNYQYVTQLHGRAICEKGGTVPFPQIQAKHIQADLDALKPTQARHRKKVWTLLCDQAGSDAISGVKKPVLKKTDGYVPWSQSDVEAFRAHWPQDTPQRLAMELIYWTGARMSDAVRLGPGMVDVDGWLCFAQQKTKGEVFIPIERDPPDFCDARDLEFLRECFSAQDVGDTWIVTGAGKSRSIKSATQWLSSAARDAALHRTGHGLRKARAREMAERGATLHQIGAWTGHESLKEIQHYSKAAEKKRILG